MKQERAVFTGHIESIDDLSDSVTRITTNINTTFRSVTTNYIDITNRRKLMGMSSDATQPPNGVAPIIYKY